MNEEEFIWGLEVSTRAIEFNETTSLCKRLLVFWRKKEMTRWIILGIVLLILVGGFFGFRALQQGRAETAASDWQTVEVKSSSLTATVGASGTLRANQIAKLMFQTSGTVDQTNFQVGELVRSGDILVTLEQTSLSPQVILAEADLVAAQKALDDLLNSGQIRSQAALALANAIDALSDAEYKLRVNQQGFRASGERIAASEANLVLADNEVKKAEKAYNQVSGRPDDNAVKALARSNLSAAREHRDSVLRELNWYTGSPSETDQAIHEAEVEVTRANLADAQREWERVKDGPSNDDIRSAEARIAAAEATLNTARITAPLSGTVMNSSVMPGDQVSPGQEALEVADLTHLFVDVEVSEVDINRIFVGQPVTLEFDAVLDQTYNGEIIEVGLSGTSIQGMVNFSITVEVSDIDEFLHPGLTAAVNITVNQIDETLQVPNRAVRVREGERIVYVLENGELSQVTLELGASSDLYSQVLNSDLEEGDLLVLNPPANFDQNGFGGPGFQR
jgi:HlyD family secretion protein